MGYSQSKGQCSGVMGLIKWKLKMANGLRPFAMLANRLVLAYVFFQSVVLKLPIGFLGIGKGDWSSTIVLFEEEYKVPLLSPEVAAYVSTSIELAASVMLVLGFGTRIAAAALLIMIAVIQFTYQEHIQHVYWAVMAFTLLSYGAGCFSVDKLLCKSAGSCHK